jgi:ABC-type transport system substrate-binding protein
VFYNPLDRLDFSVLPAHAFDSTAVTVDDPFSSRPIGTGPMRFSHQDIHPRSIALEAHHNTHHTPELAGVRILEPRDPTVDLRALFAGKIDGMVHVPPSLRHEVALSDDVALKSYDLRSWWYAALNTQTGPLTEPLVRQAVDLAIDRTSLREQLIGVKPDDSNPSMEFISGPFVRSSPHYNRKVKVVVHADLARSAALMEQAGAVRVEGRWHLGDEPVVLNIAIDAAVAGELEYGLVMSLSEMLEKGGFGAHYNRGSQRNWLGPERFAQALAGELVDEFDIVLGKWSFGMDESIGSIFHTRDGALGRNNIFDWSDPETDRLLESYRAARTDTEAHAAYQALHAHLNKTKPYLYLWKHDTKSVWRNEVRNNIIVPYYYFQDVSSWRF